MVLSMPSTREQDRQHPLPMTEQSADLPLHRQTIRQVTKQPQGQFILHRIAHHAAFHPVADLIQYPMAMAKVFERTTPLLITEKIIPTEFRNIRIPLQSHEEARESAEN